VKSGKEKRHPEDVSVQRLPAAPHGALYIVATPIGNLEDITLRALRTLKEVDLIAAEDTRHTRKLLSHFGISKPLTSYYDHNSAVKGDLILGHLRKGAAVALVTDAGTPCISDPGYQLVRDAAAEGITVIPIPGVSAAVAALSASGLPTDAFAFEGFLPSRKGKRREALLQLVGEQRLLVFYESPQRLLDALMDMLEVFGERQAVVCRELTKLHEEIVRGTLSEIRDIFIARVMKGEIVILVAPTVAAAAEPKEIESLLKRFLAGGYSVRDAAKAAAEAGSLSRSEAYRMALRIFDPNDGKKV
jgi:16S rRNA (cytidine1402-2'-O)-methyltransferase